MSLTTRKLPFWGTGLAFPIMTQAGRLTTASDEALIDQSIRTILGTNPGERAMRPDFGAGLRAFVFEPMNVTTLEALRNRVRDSLIDWEPRIDVDQVNLTTENNPAERGIVWINVTYRVRSTNTVRNLVYPFYLEEGSSR
jgi:phage baseplate assembly protein W